MKNRIGIILKNRRNELNMTQMQVAIESDVTLQEYQRFEYGEREFTKCQMAKGLRICLTLELDPFEVVFEDEYDITVSMKKRKKCFHFHLS